MTGIDKTKGRVVALLVLLALAAAALHGYLPGGERAPREQPTDSAASLFAVVALLSASMVIIAIALIARLRDRRTLSPTSGGLAFRSGGAGRRRAWRFLLIGLGLILAWLLIVLLLARFVGPQGIDQATSGGPSSTAPPPTDAPGPPPQSEPPEEGGNVFAYLAATTATFLVLVAAATVVASRRQRRIAEPHWIAGNASGQSATASGPESLARAAELGLAEIGDLSREPRAAIIACYAAMESGLANAPGAVPQDSDTPSEVLARAIEHHALQADSATKLVDLFAEARFSPHVMNEAHREDAVRLLQLVLDELRSVA
jgi:hypothetical protein